MENLSGTVTFSITRPENVTSVKIVILVEQAKCRIALVVKTKENN